MLDLAIKTAILGIVASLLFLFVFSWHFYDATPKEISSYMIGVLGSVAGTSASVPPNPYNTLAQQLAEKEERLDEREQFLDQREILLEEENNRIINLILGLVLALFGLVIFNFYLDYRSRKK